MCHLISKILIKMKIVYVFNAFSSIESEAGNETQLIAVPVKTVRFGIMVLQCRNNFMGSKFYLCVTQDPSYGYGP